MNEASKNVSQRVRKYAVSDDMVSRVADVILDGMRKILGDDSIRLHPNLSREIARDALRASDRDKLRRLLLAAEVERDYALDELETDLRSRADQIAAFKDRVARSRTPTEA